MTTYDQRGQTVSGDQYNVAGDLFIDKVEVILPVPADAVDRRNLAILRDKVKSFWIEGVLEKSLHNEMLIELGKEMDLDAVEHPWERVRELPGQDAQTVPPGKKIGELFAEMGKAMLILGEPGSGKTITLLDLARELIQQLEADEIFRQPVPVVFNLSSWTKGQKLIDWLAAELSIKYQIPKRIGRPWLEHHRLLPLLDGLDEVRADDRAACVEAINAFGEEYGLAGLVICSRLAEYTALPVRLKLNGAIRLQPLTPAQEDDYLTRMGSAVDTLRKTLQEDEPLRELAQSPLMLNIMSLAYQDGAVQPKQPLETVEVRRDHLFDAYIHRMFTRKGKREKPYTDEQTTKYLAHLAQAMQQRGQSIFFIEQIERDWLAAPVQRIAFTFVVVLVFSVSIGGIVFQLVDLIATQIIGPTVLDWIVGGIVGASVGLFFGLRKITFIEFVGRSWQRDLPRLVVRMAIGLVSGGVAGFVLGLSIVILLDLMNITNLGMTNIQELLPSGPNAVQMLGIFLAYFSAIVGSFIGIVLGNMVSGKVETTTKPNQLIREAASNVVIGVIVGGIYGLALGFFLEWFLVMNFYDGEFFDFFPNALYFGKRFAWDFGFLLALLFGGASIIKHASLRSILVLAHHLPFSLTRFLDHAADLIFLRKVGGGYIFVHRLLLEHFAELDGRDGN